MTGADDNPHRRNLSVTSFLFLLYFWAGGSLDNGALKLPVVSIEIERPWVVAAMAWAVLLFFAWRYLVKTKNARDDLLLDCEAELGIDDQARHWSHKHISNQTKSNLSSNLDKGGVTQTVRTDWGWPWQTLELTVQRIAGMDKGYILKRSGAHDSKYEVNRWNAFRLRMRIWTRAARKHAGFSDHVLPYLLFATVCLTGLHSLNWEQILAYACEAIPDCYRT